MAGEEMETGIDDKTIKDKLSATEEHKTTVSSSTKITVGNFVCSYNSELAKMQQKAKN